MNYNIEEIMAPFLQKKEEVEQTMKENEVKLAQIEQEYNATKDKLNERFERQKELLINEAKLEQRVINLRIKNLNDKKDREIAEYVQNATLNGENFYSGYTDMIKRDLEKAYSDQLNGYDDEYGHHKGLYEELEDVKNNLGNLINQLKGDYSKNFEQLTTQYNIDRSACLYPRDYIITKVEAFNKLTAIKESLEAELKDVETKIRNYQRNYDYNDPSTYFSLDILNKRDELIEQLDIVNRNLDLINLTDEEKNSLIVKEEVKDKIKALPGGAEVIKTEVKEEPKEVVEEVEETKEETSKQPKEEDTLVEEDTSSLEEQSDVSKEDGIVDRIKSTVESIMQSKKEQEDKTVENYQEFVKMIFDDVMAQLESVDSIKLKTPQGLREGTSLVYSSSSDSESSQIENSIQLPDGRYINEEDLYTAIEAYRKKHKGTTYTVRKVGNTLRNQELQFSKLDKLRSVFKRCAAIKLLADKKLSSLDIRRVFGKTNAENMAKEAELGTFKTKLKEGVYVLREDVLKSIPYLFKEKTSSWINRIFNRNYGNEPIEISSDEPKKFVK